MFDQDLTIKSHKGSYTARFVDDPFAVLSERLDGRAHLIIDQRVQDLYSAQLSGIGDYPSVLSIEATEPNKSLDKFPAYVDHLVKRKLRRDHRIIAVGGGIIQDITCFLAATMLRGVDWEFFPTTLLSQADSCIGSKSSINSGDAKNILGTFTPPRDIFISESFLATLENRDVRSGVGEMLKVHAIKGPEAFQQIAGDYDHLFADPSCMRGYIRASLEIKKEYIEVDEFDQGIRNIFNYGHSFGHAIEAATDFQIPHGIAVTIGMDMANFVAAKIGRCDEQHYLASRDVLRKNYAAYAAHPVPFDAFLSAISKDKKNIGQQLSLILPGKDRRVSKDQYDFSDALKAVFSEYLETARTI